MYIMLYTNLLQSKNHNINSVAITLYIKQKVEELLGWQHTSWQIELYPSREIPSFFYLKWKEAQN